MIYHPMQRIFVDSAGVARFRKNEIVSFLLDRGKFTMNDLAMMTFPQEDREQFAQLIGYSVSGFSDLQYASPQVIRRAQASAARKLFGPR